VGCLSHKGSQINESSPFFKNKYTVWEGKYGANTVHMYVKEKMRPVEITSGMRRGRIQEKDGGGEFILCKNFYKSHNVPPPTTVRKKKKKEQVCKKEIGERFPEMLSC
jgi:hypothetical protein